MLSLNLKTGESVELIDATFQQFVIAVPGMEEYIGAWQKLTAESAMEDVTITKDDNVIQRMKNIVLDGTQAVYNPNGTITGHFYFRGDVISSETESEDYVTAAKILLGEEE